NLNKYVWKNIDELKKLFKHTFENFKDYTNDEIKLILQKGIYMYDYMDNVSRFYETKFPSKKAFYSKLDNCNISDEEYNHAKSVYEVFKCKNLKDYTHLYLKCDTLLLADIISQFRNLAIKDYGLDPSHYYTLSGYTWDCAFKYSKVRLQLFNNEQLDMLLFIENNIRGGISSIMKRYSEANNIYMENYDKNKENIYILPVDANNLYGGCLQMKLPHSDFKWENIKEYYLNDNEINVEKILNINVDDDRGYIFEVDLIIPKELHDYFNDYPPAPENIIGEFSPIISKQIKDLKLKTIKCKKLIPNLYDKKNYVTHIKNLQLYIKLGLKINKIRRILSFKQEAYFKDYIQFNTNKRKIAKSDFEKDFYKALNNMLFGKTMEDIRKHRSFNILVHPTDNQFYRLSNKPTFKDNIIIDKNLCIIEMSKKKIEYLKPIIIGYSILEMSKAIMYDFYYNVMKKKYGNNIKLLYTDTDSLCMEIKTYDLFKDLK